jgi:tetratricopeptide (TPR) repeat protein
MASRMLEPLQIPAGFWTWDSVCTALDERDIGELFRLLRRYTGVSQTRIGIAVGMPQSQVSLIMSTGPRRRHVTAHDVFARIADGLAMPDHARRRLGLAPAIEPANGRPGIVLVPSDHGPALNGGQTDDTRGDVRRRDLFELAGAAVVGAALGPGTPRANQLHAFAEALTRYPALRAVRDGPVRDLDSLRTATIAAKRMYQSCQYAAVGASLPGLLVSIEDAAANVQGDAWLRLQSLAADAYHVAASVLLKLDDQGLASLASDRSIRAAEHSGDPLVLGSSARILTHTLMNGGHLARAAQLAGDMAAQLDSAVTAATPESLSVYGALLLRGSIAAANDDNRGGALTLLDEADEASRRLGTDSNHHWTAFGPTNVVLHRVNIATTLGDAGQAIEHARHVKLDQVHITERRAALFVDVARAYNQWGRYEHAYQAIRQAEAIAPEEIRSRPAVHRLIADLVVRSPATVQSKIREYANQLGVLA